MGSAQVNVEFFIFMGLAFMITIAFGVTSVNQLKDFSNQKENEAVKDLALKLQKELIVAATVEDGYLRVFNISDKLENINYSLTTVNSIITVQSANALYIVSIPNIVGNLSKGKNVINKTGGVIRINGASLPQSITDLSICQNAQDSGLCSGLDILYGSGYQATCCSEHVLCC